MGLFSSSKSSKQPGSGVPQNPGSTLQPSSSGSSSQVTSQPSSSRTVSAAGPHRPIFLLSWPSGTFKAHWAIFIPEAGDKTSKKSKYFHVEGNLRKGFNFVIVRGWDLNLSRSRPDTPIEIGWLLSDLVQDTPTTDDKLFKESIPRDDLEAILAAVPAPGKSLNSVSSGVPSSVRSFNHTYTRRVLADSQRLQGRNVELSDCQWWVTRCIHHLVEKGYLIPPPKGLNKNKDPREALAEASRH